MKKTIAILIVTLPLFLQAQVRHEFDIHVGGGVSLYNYNVSQGKSQFGMNLLGGVDYSCFFHPQWGIGIGAQASLLNGKYKLADHSEIYMTYDSDGNEFEYRYSINNFEEKQQTVLVQIPVMVRFNTSLEKKTQFYAALGVKIGLPVSNKNSRSIENLLAQHYDESSHLHLPGNDNLSDDNIASEGYGSFNNISATEKMSLSPILFSAAAELGARFTLSPKVALYAGVYCDYGLNNLYKTTDGNGHLIEYAKHQNGIYTPESAAGTVSKKVNPLETGVKIALAFDLGKKNKVAPVEEEEESLILVEVVEPEPVMPPPPPAVEVVEKTVYVVDTVRIIETVRVVDTVHVVSEAVKEIFEKALNGIQFESGKDVIKPESFFILDQVVGVMNENPAYQLIINGHTDNDGNPKMNQELSEKRAAAVKNYLYKKGIDEKRMTTAGYGDTKPIADNSTAAGKARNRRVEFIVKFENIIQQ